VTGFETARDFLVELGADEVAHHAGRSLLDHLIATHDLLVAWKRPPAVALAGLCHSVYGTQAFDVACVAPGERDRVRAAIGEHAERLAFLFSALDRERFLAAPDALSVTSRFDGASTSIDVDERTALCDILIANELDLAIAKKGADRPDKIAKKVAPFIAALEPHISPETAAAYEAAISELNR